MKSNSDWSEPSPSLLKINTKISISDSIIASNSDISLQNSDQIDKKFLLGEGTKISL